MYTAFFGLKQAPFSIAPDPHYLFLSGRHREALAHLLYGLEGGGGFVLLTGEVGTGKTMLCRYFFQRVPERCIAAYIFNPRLGALELLTAICDEFSVVPVAAIWGQPTAKECIDALNAFLLQTHAAGKSCVLVIDEAQNLAPEVLEQLRLLTNLETNEKKLLQIILVGQPELRDMIASPQLTQLAQRVIARYHLGPLSASETVLYIARRLAVAGWQGPLPFARGAVARVHAVSRGVPRRINLLCDRALLGAYASGQRVVDTAMVRHAAKEVFGAEGMRADPRRWHIALAAVLGVLVIAGALFATSPWWRTSGSGAGSATAPAAAGAPQTSAAGPASLAQLLQEQPRDASAAWRRLARLWQVQLPAGAQPCESPLPGDVQCWRASGVSLQQLRELDRPALLQLTPSNGTPVVVLLRALIADRAVLENAQGLPLNLPWSELAPLWQGSLTTLWRAPPGVVVGEDIAATEEGASWLAQQLDRAQIARAGSLHARVQQFQQAHELPADGVAGPRVLMALNRALDVPEPRLSTPVATPPER
ncbi:MAG: AAA family ATPase [Comamonadaceae bacterium]|nr:AAA family ATPase [Burkholderiales bacterium]MEB2348539.1 AAA family ATPase [Comamonadaceae bacterium]